MALQTNKDVKVSIPVRIYTLLYSIQQVQLEKGKAMAACNLVYKGATFKGHLI